MARDPIKRAKYKRINRERRRTIKQEFVVGYLRSHPCVDCGEPDPVVLDFDHVRGEKAWPINSIIVSWMSLNTLTQEISKCDVRCANCHRRRHSKENSWYRSV